MNIILRWLSLSVCLLSLLACQQRASEAPRPASAPKYAEAPKPAEAPRPASAPSTTLQQQAVQSDKQPTDKPRKDTRIDAGKRKLIKEGELVFETRDFNKTKALIAKSVNEVQGYVAQESQDKYDDRIETRAVIRVPAENFDRLVEGLSSSAVVIDRKNIKTLDVTEEYVDLEIRLKTRREIENRYRQLLGQAKKVDDVLHIEKQIGEVREQIESAEGKLKYFNDRIAYSTLTVVYYEKVTSPVGFTSKFIQGLSGGWNNFALFIVFLANIWPFIALLIIAIIVFRRFRIRQKIRKDKKEEPK